MRFDARHIYVVADHAIGRGRRTAAVARGIARQGDRVVLAAGIERIAGRRRADADIAAYDEIVCRDGGAGIGPDRQRAVDIERIGRRDTDADLARQK